MKKTLLLSFALIVSALSFGQCTELFISEYVHGFGNNRALEIYNPTSAPVSMADYQLVRYSNGGTSPYVLTFDGNHMIESADVWVIVVDKRDAAGTGYDTMVDPALQALADTFVCPVYSQNKMFYFNGNDAVTLEKLDGTYIDVFGKIGEDPGIAWTDDAENGYTSVAGGNWLTKRQTLKRRESIQGGLTVNPPFFFALTDWDSLPNMTFDHLQWHVSSCQTTGVEEVTKKNDCFFYPNPSSTGFFMVKGTEIIKSVEVINVIGEVVIIKENPVQRGDIRIETNNLDNGIYFVNVYFNDNTSTTKKVIIN